uniref:Sosondowah ankyrin repeat domain family member B n=1 Tax=Malurus cyaneus samueli TaxID=2593467 RepID=A0A8C5U1R0_9PASS
IQTSLNMARELSQEAVLDFLWAAGGRAPNTALLRHFQRFLRDPALTEQQRRERREYFKSLVNSLATVHPAASPGASKDIVLRRRYRDLLDEELPPPEEQREQEEKKKEPEPPPPPRPPPRPPLSPAGLPRSPSPPLPAAGLPSARPPSPSRTPPPPWGRGMPPPYRLPQPRSPPQSLTGMSLLKAPLPSTIRGEGPPAGPIQSPLLSSGPRALSPRDLSSPRNAASRGPLVPLGQREHAWLVAMSAGCWAQVRGLFLEEPELALQKDFISGFTVLHWLAKHGDGPGLQELAAAARQLGLALDVDVRSGCGYTPLHLAAIHGHQLVIKVLVLQLGCQVQVRDGSGRRPWEYLGSSTSGEIWQLLERATDCGRGWHTTALLSTTAARGCPAASLLLPHSCISSCSPHTTGLGSGTCVVARALLPRLGTESIVAEILCWAGKELCCSTGPSLPEGRQFHNQSCIFPETPALNYLFDGNRFGGTSAVKRYPVE